MAQNTGIAGIKDSSESLTKFLQIVDLPLGKYAPRAVFAYYVLRARGVDVGVSRFPWPRLNKETERQLIVDPKQNDLF